MRKVYWLEQSMQDVPGNNDWLSDQELSRLAMMRFEKRRSDWRLGRWTAKLAVSQQLKLPATAMNRIEIATARTGAPEVIVSGIRGCASISISHRSGIAACALADGFPHGCDLETPEPRSRSFVSDYLTPDEQAAVAEMALERQALAVAVIWSAKESVLKALGVGLRMDTRYVNVQLGSAESLGGGRTARESIWSPLSAQIGTRRCFSGWWNAEIGLVRTFAAETCTEPPCLTTYCTTADFTSV